MKIKAIAFDLDGTLYPEHRILLPSLRIALRYPRFIYYFSRVRKEIRDVFPITDFKKTQAEFLSRYIRKTPEETAELIEKIVYTQWLSVIKKMKPYRGIRALIINARNAGFKTAVLSDLPVKKKLSYLGLEGIWDFVFSSEETHYLKPNRAPFQLLIEKFGEKPENILYIGNNYLYDIVGAKAMGIKTAYFSYFKKQNCIADIVLRSFAEFEKFLRSFGDGTS